MVHVLAALRSWVRLAIAVVCLTAIATARPAHARQVLFVSNPGNNTVGEYDATTGAPINSTFLIGSQGLANPYHLVFDGNDFLLVSSTVVVHQGNSLFQGWIGKFNARTGATINSTFASGIHAVKGMAVDGSNHLFALSGDGLDAPYGFLLQFDATTGVLSGPVGPNHPAAEEMILDHNNHFVVDFSRPGSNSSGILEYDSSTGAQVNGFVASGLVSVGGMLVDSLNHLLVSDSSANTVVEFDATTGATINATFIAGLNSPYGLALDGNNHLFVVNSSNGTVGEYDATTGATINASFITGLNGAGAIAFMAPVPEPSSLLLVAFTTVTGIYLRRGRIR